MTTTHYLYLSSALVALFFLPIAILVIWHARNRRKPSLRHQDESDDDNDGTDEMDGTLLPFSASYRFDGRRFGIVVWANSFADTREYCVRHGLTFDPLTDGEIVGHSDS